MNGTEIGSIIGAAGLAGLLVLQDRRMRTAAFAAWAVGAAILAGDLLHSPIATLRVEATDRPALAVAAAAAGLAALAAGAVIAHRFPTLTLLAVVAAAPARIPLHAGGEQANLLVPLYGVILAMATVSAYQLVRGAERPPALGPAGWALAALAGWGGLSLLWSADTRQGGVEMLFFYLPFGFLLSRLAAMRPSMPQLRLMLGVQVLLGLVFGAVAIWQHETRHLFWNHKIMVGNEYGSFFRVNSLFYDASIYGRFMAVTIVLLLGVLVYRRLTVPLVAVVAALFAAQYLAYSQSSLLALAAGAAVLGATFWPRRLVAAMALTVVVIGVAGLVVSSHGGSARQVTSGRSRLVEDGWRVIRHHPLGGAGLGGFARAALAGTAHPGRTKSAASHTTPVTVLAELGPLGLAAYLALAASVGWAAVRAGPDRDVRVVLAAALAAMLASSLFYNAYFEDPASWILTALIASMSFLQPPSSREAGA
ncbi:MAG TPA: O-antigen ligase family protein [Gaiellales bacterium]